MKSLVLGLAAAATLTMTAPACAQTLEGTPLPKSDAERRILSVLDDLDRNQRPGNMNVPAEDGRLLRLLAESITAKHVVEIGTSTGISGLWFCLALQKTDGKLTTFEIDPARAATAREHFKKAGVDRMVSIVEGDAHDDAGAPAVGTGYMELVDGTFETRISPILQEIVVLV